MADKQQNILINFKYQTAELEKGTQLVNRANEANNKLQDSAHKAGQGISNSFRGATQSIGAMQIQLARLKTLIEINTNPQKVKALSDQYKQLKTELDKATKAAFDNKKAMDSVNQSAGSLKTALQGIITVAVVRELVNYSLELVKLAGNAEGVERAFRRSFANSTILLEDLKTATHGTVSEFELMQRTLQATNLGVNVREIPILFEFAAARAQQTGESVDYLVDSIVRGIGLKSLRVLDNLGLSATRLKEQFNGASLASQSVADVTKGVAEIARQDLDKMGGYAETAATKIDRIAASWQNLKVIIGERIDPSNSGVGSLIDYTLEAFELLIGGEQRYIDKIYEEEAARKANAIVSKDAYKELEGQQGKQLEFITREIAEIQRLVNLREKEIQQANNRISVLADDWSINPFTRAEISEESEALGKRVKDMERSKAVLQATIPILLSYTKELKNQKTDEEEVLGIIEKKKKEIEDIQNAIEKTRKSTDLSDRRGTGKLITDLAVAQAELKELLEGAANIEFKVKFDLSKLKADVQNEMKVIGSGRHTRADGQEIFIEVPVRAVYNKTKAQQDFEALADLSLDPIPVPVKPVVIDTNDFWDKLSISIKENQKDIINSGVDLTADLLKSAEEAELASLQNRMNNLRNFYDEQILLAGNNDRVKQQLRLKEEQETQKLQKRMAEREKRIRSFNVVIDTAASIAKTAAQLGFPAAIPFIAIAAATGLAQLATINRTPARFAKGGINIDGPGTGTSDEIPALISRGESVMTAKETQSSMGILKEIRAKRLDDKVLANLKLSSSGVTYQPTDISPVVKEIRALRESQPDLVEQNGKLYKQYTKAKIHKIRTRVKVMGK